ncbi:MAG: hypothetical protein HYZ87_03725 [Candidatus Omnitrophica bacterium]|nr:hypothetical protein [Candidatus Omnitrophota bacterium]
MLIFAVPSLCLIGYQAVFGEHMFDLSRVREYFAWPLILKKIVGIFWHFSSGYRFSMLTIDRVFFYLKSSPFFWVSAVNTLAVLLVALKGFFGLRREKFEWGLLFGITLFFPVVFLGIFYPIRLDARYLSFAAPFFFILAADGLRRISARSVRAVVLAVLIFVSLEGSQYAISAVTDPAHKEDYRGLVSYVYANAAASDAICGLEQQASYYRKRLGLQTPADYFARIDDLAAAGPSAYRVVWLMDGANMHPEVTRQAYRQIIEIMKKLGFEPAAEPRKFGGEEALTVLYKFREITA